MMRKIMTVLFFAAALAGCATTGADLDQYGNFIATTDVGDQQQLAYSAAAKLATLYPPAKTQLELLQPTPDMFGQTLVLALRDHGYALVEYNPASPASTGTGLPLRYVLDRPDANLYRLTLLVGNQSLTRPYSVQDGSLAPAGNWMRKE